MAKTRKPRTHRSMSHGAARKLGRLLADVARLGTATEPALTALHAGRASHCTFCDLWTLQTAGLVAPADAELDPRYAVSARVPLRFEITDLGRVALAWAGVVS